MSMFTWVNGCGPLPEERASAHLNGLCVYPPISLRNLTEDMDDIGDLNNGIYV